MKVRAVLGLNDLEALWNRLNGRHLVVLALRQTGHASLAAVRTTQLLVPLIGHLASMDPGYRKFHAPGNFQLRPHPAETYNPLLCSVSDKYTFDSDVLISLTIPKIWRFCAAQHAAADEQ